MKKNLTFSKVMMIVMMAILPLSFYAQKKQNVPVEKYFYISAEGGLSVNHTDLANYGFIPFVQDGKFVLNDGYVFRNFNGQLGLGYQFGKVIGLTGKFGYGTLGGEKRGQILTPYGNAIDDYTNLQLEKTTLIEGNLNVTFNLTNLFFGYNPRRVVNFIPHIGIGGLRYTAGKVNQLPAVNNTTGDNAATALLPEAAAAWTYTVPVGAELSFNVGRKLDIYLDYTFTWAGNDKLDQVEKVFYPEGNAGRRVPESVDGIQVINDMYSHVNLGLRYKFNKKPCDIEGMAERANEIGMRVNPEQLEEKEGKVCFDVIFTVPAEYFEDKAVMNITPSFNYKGGQMELEPVTFVGEKVNTTDADFQVNYKNGGEFTKHYCVDYVPELESSKLVGTPVFYVYNGKIYPTQDEIVKNVYFTRGGERVLANGVLVPVVKCEAEVISPVVENNSFTVRWIGEAESFDIFIGDITPDAKPTVEGVKGNSYTFENMEVGNYKIYVKANCGNDLSGDWIQSPKDAEITPERKPIAILFFDYQSANLNKNDKRNKVALKAIAEKIASGEAITGFEIEGWASPENGDGNNNVLSNDRAKAAEKAIKDQLKKNAKDFTFDATGFGSDWKYFEELVKNSNIKDKDQILNVIKNAGESKKEQEIQNMKLVYDEIREDILPVIRRVEIYVK